MADGAIDKTENIWAEKVEEYEVKGMPIKKARTNAYKYVFDIDKNEFCKIYTGLLKMIVPLNESEMHKKIMTDIIELEERDLSLKQRIKKVLTKYNHWFNVPIS